MGRDCGGERGGDSVGGLVLREGRRKEGEGGTVPTFQGRRAMWVGLGRQLTVLGCRVCAVAGGSVCGNEVE